MGRGRGLLILAVFIGALSAPIIAAGPVSADFLGDVTEYSVVSGQQFNYRVLTAGPDGNIWFLRDFAANTITKMSPSGVVLQDYVVPTANSSPNSITSGPDGNLWFIEQTGNKVGRITPSGTITEYPIPTASSRSTSITRGPDNFLWFSEYDTAKIAKINPNTGVITEYPVPGGQSPGWMVSGPDGNLWFTVSSAQLGKATTSGFITTYNVAANPRDLAAGPDGLVWFSDFQGIRGINTTGAEVAHYVVPYGADALTNGPDGHLWIVSDEYIARMTSPGVFKHFQIPQAHLSNARIDALTPGLDGNVWFAELDYGYLGKIGAESGSLGEMRPVTPQRILDTRPGTPAPGHKGALGPGQSIAASVLGSGGLPTAADDVVAVVMNVTATKSTSAGYLTLYPDGLPMPLSSNLNFAQGQTVPNLVTVKVGTNGMVRVANGPGVTHVIFDIVGWYSSVDGPDGSRFHAVSPTRLADTRPNAVPLNGPKGVLGPGRTIHLSVANPSVDGVSAVVLNVTVTQPVAGGFVTVFPGDVPQPPTSSLNYTASQTVANLVVVRVPASGIVDFVSPSASTHLVVDLMGSYDDDESTEAGRFFPLDPTRLIDTRDFAGALGPDEIGVLEIAGFEAPASAEAVVLNVTATRPTIAGYLTVFPDDLPSVPLASNLNFRAGQTVPNLTMVGVSIDPTFEAPDAGAVDFYNGRGFTHLIVDLFGYFSGDAGITFPPVASFSMKTSTGDTVEEPGAAVSNRRRLTTRH